MKLNKPYLHIFNLLLILAAYGYLAYRLMIFDDYATCLSTFKAADMWLWLSLVVVLVLMPLNIWCEAAKWRLLLHDIEPLSIYQAQSHVYYGYVGAFITPYHTGEYPARAMLLKDKQYWAAAVGLGLVGTLALLVVELTLGLPATWLFVSYDQSISMQSIAFAVITIVVLFAFLPHLLRYLSCREWKINQIRRLFTALSQISYPLFLKTIAWSMLRYIIWAIQLALTLHFCGVNLTLAQYAIAIPCYYMVVAIFPSIPVANIAIRGSWSLIIFGVFSANTAGIAMAVAIIWLINTVLPMLMGSILYRSGKPKNP